MAKRLNRPPSGDVGFNMTPMIDCVFQLIIFFILASQVANDAYAKDVKIVRPYKSMAIPASVAQFPNKVTVNVVSAAAGEENPDPEMAADGGHFMINGKKFKMGETDRMAEVIKSRKREYEQEFGKGQDTPADGSDDNPGMFFLEVRADERVNWRDVAPAIRAGIEAGISKLNITALTAN